MEDLHRAIRVDAITLKTSFDAIEADISWNSIFSRPIMKHARESDSLDLECTTEEWLDLTLHQKNVHIVKLDFKSLKAVKGVLTYIAREQTAQSPHLFLNADVLAGPGSSGANSAIPLDVNEFLDACNALPDATLSLGWTTAWSPFYSIVYGHEHIDEMIGILTTKAKDRRITFPLRASLVRDSWPAIVKLLEHSPLTSLTLWTALEGVPEEDLVWILEKVNDHDRVFIDCDKGPKHPRQHPVRIAQYLYEGIKYKMFQ